MHHTTKGETQFAGAQIRCSAYNMFPTCPWFVWLALVQSATTAPHVANHLKDQGCNIDNSCSCFRKLCGSRCDSKFHLVSTLKKCTEFYTLLDLNIRHCY